MNCPSRTEEPEGDGFNQNPSSLAADLTTRQDLNGIANTRILRRTSSSEILPMEEHDPGKQTERDKSNHSSKEVDEGTLGSRDGSGSGRGGGLGGGKGTVRQRSKDFSVDLFMRARKFTTTFGKFIGPGFMVTPRYTIHIVPR